MTVWTEVCRYDDLVVDRGVAAMVDGVPVAVFRLADDSIVALDNRDPISGANIMSRGLIGTKGDVAYVASPMYKQRFAVGTGRCLDDDEAALNVYAARLRDGTIEVTVSRGA